MSTKVVLNTCFGGFSLSPVAQNLYNSVRGFDYGDYDSPLLKDPIFDGHPYGEDPENVLRRDPVLVWVVETLGTQASSGNCAKLVVEDVGSLQPIEISSYDGKEDWNYAR